MINTVAQERSAFALEEIRNFQGKRTEFAKMLAGLPAMILQNGFGHTLAFLLAKGTGKDGRINQADKHIQAFDIMVSWLVKRNALAKGDRADTMKVLSTLPQEDYLYAQEEAMQVLEWVKRYAGAGLFST
jgi:CRISPR-associated protein Cmr5